MNFIRTDLNASVDASCLVARARSISLVVSLGVLALQVSVAQAQGFEGQSFRLGETEVTPEVRLDYVTVDNTFRTAEDPIESTGFIVSPAVNWTADRRLLTISANYRGKYGTYSESVLDFTDHALAARVGAALATRHRATGSITMRQEHEEVGTGQSALVTDSSDQIVTTILNLQSEYIYGAKNAKGNLGFGLAFNSTSYKNVEFLTTGDDNTSIRPHASFSYRVSPDTRLVAEVQHAILDYDENRRDRAETSILVGLNLNATARTGGRIRLGTTTASFDSSNVSDTTEFVTNINFYYRPRSYSRLNFNFVRDLSTLDNDPTGAGQSINDRASVGWSHNWSSRFSTNTRFSTVQQDRECPNIDTVANTIGFEFSVKIRRWISIGAGVSQVDRKAGNCGLLVNAGDGDYDLTRFGLHLAATL